MAHKIDDVDLTPPPVDDEVRFRVWLIENMGRVRTTLIDGFTGTVIVGSYTLTYEFGVLLTYTLTDVFTPAFSEAFV